jgi:hypothetical protein
MTVSELSSPRYRCSFVSGSIASVFVAFLVAVASSSVLPSVGAISAGSPNIVCGKASDTSGSSSDIIKSSSDSDSKPCGKQRGKLLGERFDEHDLLRAYEEIKLEYHDKAFAEDDNDNDQQTSWKLLTTMNPNKKRYGASNNDDDDDEIIKVSMLEHPSDPLCPYVKMETVIPMPVEKCWDFLSLDRWDETMPKMDPFYEGLDIYGEYSVRGSKIDETETATATDTSDVDVVKMILARKRTKRILAFGKREFVFVSVEDTPLEDGTWVSGTVSVEVGETETTPKVGHDKSKGENGDADSQNDNANALQSLRRNKSYTRAFQDSIAFYKPLPAAANDENSSGRTRLTIICRIDLNDSSGEHSNGSGGCIPMWLYVKTIGITGARSVLTMRKCLLEG